MKICFLQMHIPDPRTNKRIAVAKDVGSVTVICVRRITQDIYEPVYKDIPHYIYPLDIPTSKRLFKRYIVSRKFNKIAIDKLNDIRPDIVYCGGLDSLFLACQYKKKHECTIYYEVADLRECFIGDTKSLKNVIEKNVIGLFEKKAFKSVDFLTLTSMKFYEYHYRNFVKKRNVIYVPNVPDISLFNGYQHKNSGNFTIGFIGGIRYIDQMKLLVDASYEVGGDVLFAGAGGTNDDYRLITQYCSEKDWVTFSGKYDYATQIAELYGSVDCVYAVYDADNPNVRIALPNKLYESVYCELPIIVAKGTYLSELVEQYGIGISVNHKSKEDLCMALKLLMDIKEYNKIRDNCKKRKSEIISNEWINILRKSFANCER